MPRKHGGSVMDVNAFGRSGRVRFPPPPPTEAPKYGASVVLCGLPGSLGVKTNANVLRMGIALRPRKTYGSLMPAKNDVKRPACTDCAHVDVTHALRLVGRSGTITADWFECLADDCQCAEFQGAAA